MGVRHPRSGTPIPASHGGGDRRFQKCDIGPPAFFLQGQLISGISHGHDRRAEIDDVVVLENVSGLCSIWPIEHFKEHAIEFVSRTDR